MNTVFGRGWRQGFSTKEKIMNRKDEKLMQKVRMYRSEIDKASQIVRGWPTTNDGQRLEILKNPFAKKILRKLGCR